jgi:archaellum component FlaC
LKQEIDGLGATNHAKDLGKQAAEKNAMVNRLVANVRSKMVQSKKERLASTNEKLTQARDTLEEKDELIKSQEKTIEGLSKEVQDMGEEVARLVQECEKLNKLRVEEIQKTYDAYIGYINSEKKARELEVKDAQSAIDKEMKALELTTKKLEEIVLEKSKHVAIDAGLDIEDEKLLQEDEVDALDE